MQALVNNKQHMESTCQIFLFVRLHIVKDNYADSSEG